MHHQTRLGRSARRMYHAAQHLARWYQARDLAPGIHRLHYRTAVCAAKAQKEPPGHAVHGAQDLGGGADQGCDLTRRVEQ